MDIADLIARVTEERNSLRRQLAQSQADVEKYRENYEYWKDRYRERVNQNDSA